jgi:hypothetical protein
MRCVWSRVCHAYVTCVIWDNWQVIFFYCRLDLVNFCCPILVKNWIKILTNPSWLERHFQKSSSSYIGQQSVSRFAIFFCGPIRLKGLRIMPNDMSGFNHAIDFDISTNEKVFIGGTFLRFWDLSGTIPHACSLSYVIFDWCAQFWCLDFFFGKKCVQIVSKWKKNIKTKNFNLVTKTS